MEPVAHPPHGLQRVPPERPVDLLSQVSNVDLDHVRVSVVGEVPHVRQKLRAREDLSGVAHEVLQQRELLRSQFDRLLRPPDSLGRGIEPQVPHGDYRRSSAPTSRPRTRSGTASLAVSMSTGAHWPASRIRRQTSKPSTSGSITSSTMASYGFSVAIQMPSAPFAATSAA